MLKSNFHSFSIPKIDHREYEEKIIKVGAFSGNLEPFERIVKRVGLDRKRVLDLASGDGSFGMVARKLGAEWQLDALDFSIPEKDNKQSHYKHYDAVFEESAFDFNFEQYDYVVANHFFEHLYINQIIELMDRMKGAKLIISVPLAHATLAYNRFFLAAAKDVDTIKNYDYLIGGMHKTCFDKTLCSYLQFKRDKDFNWCQILVNVKELSDKDKYMAQLYVTMSQEKFRYQIINYGFYLALLPYRLVRRLFRSA